MRPRTGRTLLLDEQDVSNNRLQHYRRLSAKAQCARYGSQFVGASRSAPAHSHSPHPCHSERFAFGSLAGAAAATT